MKIEKVNPKIKYLYHYTLKKNVNKILNDKSIKSEDQFVFFTKNLNDSIAAFEREMMQENRLYIDINGHLRKREKCNKEDYCILKIPFVNDNEFYKFSFENQSQESIYTISVTHKGNYNFKQAKVLEFPQKNKINFFNKTAAVAIAASAIMLPCNIYAASWLDDSNYDISWYTSETQQMYTIDTAEKLAGLAHLVNEDEKTFEGKIIEIIGNIDLRENTWETIGAIFKGEICGSHRIILNLLDGKLLENLDIVNVDYSLDVLVDNTLKEVTVSSPYTIAALKSASNNATTVFLNQEQLLDGKSLFELNLNKNKILNVISGMYIFVENASGENEILSVESGESIDNVKQMYSIKINVPIDKIVLKSQGKELNDGRTLADYNIQKEATINAYIKNNINIQVVDGKGKVTTTQKTALSGEKITITLKPNSGYEVEKVIVNGIDKTEDVQKNKLNVECGEEEINIQVSYKLKEQSTIDNPQTEDGILKYIITSIISFLGILFIKRTK